MKFTKSKKDDQLFFVSHNDIKCAVYGTEKHLVEIGVLESVDKVGDGWVGVWIDIEAVTPSFESKQAIQDYFKTFYCLHI